MDLETRITELKQTGEFIRKFHTAKGTDREKNIVIATITKRTVDRDGEVVLPRSFESDLDYYLANPIVLWAHNYKDPPIAQMVDYKITNDEFVAHDRFAVKEYPFAKTIFNLYAGGYLRAFSVGFKKIATSEKEGGLGGTYTQGKNGAACVHTIALILEARGKDLLVDINSTLSEKRIKELFGIKEKPQ